MIFRGGGGKISSLLSSPFLPCGVYSGWGIVVTLLDFSSIDQTTLIEFKVYVKLFRMMLIYLLHELQRILMMTVSINSSKEIFLYGGDDKTDQEIAEV